MGRGGTFSNKSRNDGVSNHCIGNATELLDCKCGRGFPENCCDHGHVQRSCFSVSDGFDGANDVIWALPKSTQNVKVQSMLQSHSSAPPNMRSKHAAFLHFFWQRVSQWTLQARRLPSPGGLTHPSACRMYCSWLFRHRLLVLFVMLFSYFRYFKGKWRSHIAHGFITYFLW